MIKKLKAIFLLSVIFVMILHNAIPHVHHTHDENGSFLGTGKYDHHSHSSEEHHHHHTESNSKSEHDHPELLCFLFDAHVHDVHSQDCVALPAIDVKIAKKRQLSDYPFKSESCFYKKRGNYKLSDRGVFVQADFTDPYNVQCTLRGPPSQG